MRGGGVLTFLDEQLHHDHSASQGQVGVVDSSGYPTGRCPPRSSGRPWARLDLSPDTTLSVTSFSDSTGVEDDRSYRKRF